MANYVRYMLRSDEQANWQAKNPVLLKGEPGFDMTNNRLKIGTGGKTWSETEYLNPQVINDLDTGGTTNALSAEQGKVLKSLADTKATITTVNNLTTRVGALETIVKDGVVSEAPKNSTKYARCNGAWVAV